VFPSRKIDSLFFKLSRLAAGVVGDLSAEYHGNVTTGGKELHDLGALAGQFGSARFGLRVLLEGAIGDSVEFEVYPGQVAFCGMADGVGFTAHGDVLGALDDGLPLTGNEGSVPHGSVLCGRHGANHSGWDSAKRSGWDSASVAD
jgi:hypothetical protein